jgi:hypothetical protein
MVYQPYPERTKWRLNDGESLCNAKSAGGDGYCTSDGPVLGVAWENRTWEPNDADKAERLLRNLARRMDLEPPGVSKSILEGLDEILTVIRLGLPLELRRSLTSTNIIESMNAFVGQAVPRTPCRSS